MLQNIKQSLKEAEAVIIAAGAGMGVDSGLPDFRGDEGFWRAYPPLKKLGINFEQIANPQSFKKDPALAWAFYGHRLHLYASTTPHTGFGLLRQLCAAKDENYFIYTSNVDEQFVKAGFNPSQINEIHGNIFYAQARNSSWGEIWRIALDDVSLDENSFRAIKMPMTKNGKIARPNIVLFGDWHFNPQRQNEQARRFESWLFQNKGKKLLIIEIGAGTAIPSVRRFCQKLAETRANTTLLRINPLESEVPLGLGYGLKMGALQALNLLLSEQE